VTGNAMHLRPATYPEPIPFRFDANAHEYILEDGTSATDRDRDA